MHPRRSRYLLTLGVRLCAGPECGNELPADARLTTIYCSNSCRYRAYRIRKSPRPACAQCGSTLPIGRKRFCSNDCAHQHKIDRRRKLYIHFHCKFCGADLPPGRRADRKYCDDICCGLWHHEHRPHRGWRIQPQYTHCQNPTCGKPLPAHRNANRKYCDDTCKKQSYRQKTPTKTQG